MKNQTPKEFIEDLKNFERELANEGPGIAEKMASKGMELVKKRIVEKGVGAYSTVPIPTFWFSGNTINSGGDLYIEENLLGTWGEFRAAQGLQNGHVDLKYTGRMLRGFKKIRTVNEGTRFRVTYGAEDTETEEKLSYNMDRYGDFLEPNSDEHKAIEKVADDEVEKIIKRNLSK